MKAAVLHAYGEPEQLVYEDVPDPEPKEGEVRIKVAAASVNAYDYKLRHGYLAAFIPLEMPAIIGVDVAGTVEKIGPGVTQRKVGDRVAGMLPGHKGGYATLAVAPADSLALLPDDLDFADAASIVLVGLAGVQAVRNYLKVKAGDRILINGAIGSTGRAAIYAAKKAGAKVVAGVRANRESEAKALGLETLVLDEKTAAVAAKSFDGAVDTVGGAAATALIPLIRDGGVLAAVAGVAEGTPMEGPVGVETVYGANDPALLSELAQAAKKGELVIPIAKKLPLAKAAEGHRLAESSPGGKVVLHT